MSDVTASLGTTLAPNTTVIDSRPTEVRVEANHATLVAWLVLNVWPSHLGLPVLIATILLSRSIRRHATFINLCITWMIVGLSSSLLLYAGYTTGPEPPQVLCLIQASLLYAQPGMTSLSAFALVFQVFYVVRAAFREKDHKKNENVRKWALLIAPYIAFLIASGLTAYVGITQPTRLSRSRRFFYCSVRSSLLTNSITAFSFIMLLATLSLEFWIAYLVHKHWRVLRANDLSPSNGINLNLVIRTAAFGLWVVLGMSLSLLSMRAPASPVPDMALATMGSAVVLVFGTQRDILRSCCFWKRWEDSHHRLDFPSSPTRPRKSADCQISSWVCCRRQRSRRRPVEMSSISQPTLQDDTLSLPPFATAV